MSAVNNRALISQLIEFGLSEKEASVYLALLELEIAVVSDIAKAANINRSSTYVLLDSLREKGLVSISEDKKVKRYIPTTPEIFLYEAENKAKRAEKIKDQISNLVPKLKALHKETRNKPRVKIFEGKQGLINAFEDSLQAKEKILRAFSAFDNVFEVLPKYISQYFQRRIELGIKMYGIHPKNPLSEKLIAMAPKFDESVLIQPKKYPFPAALAIYDNKIGYMSIPEQFVMLIESEPMANVMKNIFDLAFEEAKRLNTSKK